MNAERLPPGLYIVATPIGNLGDLSPRAADTLRRADLVLAEDKRVTAKLLVMRARRRSSPTTAITQARLSATRSSPGWVEEAIALVSDAGTPLISDPGYKLVRAAREAGHAVHTVPGPSAVIAALTLAGLPTDRFLFAGFLPPKDKARRDALADLAAVRATLVFYESGPRLADTLAAIRDVLGEREAAVVREISKLYEESVTGSVSELADRYASHAPKGEIVIVVGPPPEQAAASEEDLDAALKEALERLSPSRAAAEVATALNVPRKRAYARALELSR